MIQHKIYLLTILVAFSLIASKCQDAIQTPNYLGTENTKLENLNLGGNSTIRTDLKYNNPNNFGISVKETNLKVYIENNYVADAEQPSEIKVNAKSNFTFPVVAKFNTLQMLGRALGLLSKKTINYSIKGTAKVGKGGLFIKVPVNVSSTFER